MPNATSFWGIAAGATGNNLLCRNTASTDAKTCNGDGDFAISSTPGQGPEQTRFWQHLMNAEMIEGQYSGAYHGGSYGRDETNSPTGAFNSSIWTIVYVGSITVSARMFIGEYSNVLYIQKLDPTSTSPFPLLPFLSNEEIYNIDKKIDDGLPAQGEVTVYAPFGTGLDECATDSAPVTSSSLNATYKLDSITPVCVLFFRNQF